MIQWLDHIDKEIFLFLNGLHNNAFDFMMYWVSSKALWIPLYLFFIYLLIRLFHQKFWIPLLVLLAGVALTDFTSVHLFKEVIQRPRPCHSAELEGLVHIVRNHCGGAWGFVSSHAANMFAVATMMWLFIRRQYPKSGWWLFAWASLIAYSRIYLGVHYPGDVLGGALWGAVLGVLAFSVSKRWIIMKA